MRDHDDLTYEVGKYKPPREHQFKPGVSGNPKGRPKGAVNIMQRTRNILEADDGVEAQDLARLLVDQAKGGDFKCLKEIIDRFEGTLQQSVVLDVENHGFHRIELVDGPAREHKPKDEDDDGQ